MAIKFSILVVAVSALCVSACATTVPQAELPKNTRLVSQPIAVSPPPMPDGWYITDVMTAKVAQRERLCYDCVPIIISERNETKTGHIVFYDIVKVPGLLRALGLTKLEDLVGRKITFADEKDPALAPIVKEGRECSERQRVFPTIVGKEWC